MSERRRKWLKRLAVLAALALVARLALGLALQPIARSAVAGMGLELRWEELELALHRGEVHLRGLDVSERPDAQTELDPARDPRVAHLDTLSIDIDVSRLFGGDLVIHRVEVDGLDLFIDRDREGRWSWMRWVADEADREVAEAPPGETGETGEDEPATPIELALPFELETALLQNIRLHTRDESVSPPVETRLELDVQAVNFGTDAEPGQLRIRAHAPGRLDVMRIEGTLVEKANAFELDLACEMSGFQPLPIAGLLAPLGITPEAEELDLDAHLTAQLAVNASDPTRLDASADLERFLFTADSRTKVAIDSLTAQIGGFFAGGLLDADVQMSGVELHLGRQLDGTLLVGGFALPPAQANAADSPDAPEAAEEASIEPTAPFDLGPTTLRIEDVRFVFDDAARPEPLELALELAQVNELTMPATGEAQPAELSALVSAPRLFERLEVNGQLRLASDSQDAELALILDGLDPEGLTPYLEGLPWRPSFGRGRLEADLATDHRRDAEGASLLNAELGPFVWSDTRPADGQDGTNEELARLDTIAVRGLELLSDGDVRLATVEVAGGRSVGTRNADGVVRIGGFESVEAELSATEEPVAVEVEDEGPSDPTTPEQALPSIEIGRIHWHDTKVSWRDEKLEPPLALDLEPFSFELNGLALGPQEKRAPAELRFDLGVPGLLARFLVEAEIAGDPAGAGLQTTARVQAEGIDLDTIAEYLAALGIEPRWKAGSFTASLQGELWMDDPGLRAHVAIADVALAPEGDPTSAPVLCRSATLTFAQDGESGAQKLAVGVLDPRIELARDADGVLRAGGMRFVGTSTGTEESLPATDADEATKTASSSEPSSAAPFRLESLVVEGLEVGWNDAALSPELSTRLAGRIELAGLSTVPGDPPARFDARFSVADSMEELSATGTLTPDPRALAAEADLRASGLRAGPLARYLPNGTEARLESGELDAKAELNWTRETGGAAHGFVRLVETRFVDGEREWLSLGRLAIEVERFDPMHTGVVISDVACEGLIVDSALDENGDLEVMGLAFGPSTASPEVEPTPTETSDETELDGGSESTPEQPAVAAAERPSDAWPDVLLRRMHLGIEALRFHDRSAPNTEPLTLSVALATPADLRLASPEPEELPPLTLTLAGSASPILGEIELALEIAPYLSTPTLDVRAALGAIDGAALTRVLPALDATLDASEFDGGRLAFHATGALHARRRSPIDFDFTGGFGLDGAVEELSLRTNAESEPLASLGSMTIDVARVRPATGDVHVRTLELYDPMVRVRQEAGGLRVAGLLLKNPPEPVKEAESSEGATDEPVLYDQKPERKPEYRVDQLLAQGLDFRFEDETVEPPLLLPLDDLEIEVRRFTTRALEEPRPVRFRANLGAGEVPLFVADESGNLLSSLASEVGNMIGTNEAELEERPLFDEIAVGGSLTLFPELSGWTQVDVHALELGGFRGAAAASGVDLAGGVLDGSYSIRFLGDRGAAIATSSNFHGLDVSEPESGPIEKFLGLPAPLGSVLYLLKDANGEHKIPLAFKVGAEGVSTAAISAAAAQTLLELIARAITDSPFRIVEGTLDLTGLDFSRDETVDLEEARRELAFAPGSADLTAEAREELATLVPLLRQDRGLSLVLAHRFSSGDLERADARANPSPEHLEDLVARLRGERAGLWRERDGIASEARAAFATGAQVRAEALRTQLVELDTEIARCENALDEVAELLRPGAERRRERRTRAALRALASERLDTVRSALIEAGVPAIRDRVRTRRPRLDAGGDQEAAWVELTPRRRRE